MLKHIVVFDYLSYTLCYIHNGDASTQDQRVTMKDIKLNTVSSKWDMRNMEFRRLCIGSVTVSHLHK